ncbi:cytochrome c oxidase subunit 3 [Algoriphagus sp. SE2]|uniref:cytochrome c oxidase subunit 3 n=1 Tax=Algoriphagus sp. SE2 TaxID=3141536 RepID=UPI0031CD1589
MGNTKDSQSWFQKLESLHPYETMLYLGMLGSGLIFLFLSVAFLISGLNQLEGLNSRVPIAFLVSTLLIIMSGYSASKMRIYYLEENTERLQVALRNTLFLGIAFTFSQVIGWMELSNMGINFTGIPSGSFLYVLSGIHIFHLLGAMVFAVIMWVQLRNKQRDQIKNLVLLTNPYEKMRIRLFTRYWHFMDVIWLILFFLFVLSF